MTRRDFLTEQRKAIEEVQAGEYYNGRQIISKEELIPGKTWWLSYKGGDYPRGGFFSALAELLVEIRRGHEYYEITDGEVIDQDSGNE